MTGNDKNAMVRFGIAGCGLMGLRHLEVLQSTPRARVTAAHDPDKDACAKVAEGIAIADDFDALIARDDVDAVVLCIPSALHAEYGIRAAKARKHVITEKPIDSTVAGAESLVAACRENDVVCAVISQYRFSDGNMAVKRALSEGAFGRVVMARASVKWYRHDEYYTDSDWRGTMAGEGGGVLINQAVHFVDLLGWFLGDLKEVCGYTARNRDVMETEDTAVMAFNFKSGTVATLDATTSAYPGFSERMELLGEKASCILEKNEIVEWHSATGADRPAPPASPKCAESLSSKLILFQRQYFNILDAILNGKELMVKPEEAVAAVRAIQRVYGNN